VVESDFVKSQAALAAVNIEKHFPGVQALKGVSVSFFAGEIHAVCGENGAGKSTLMHILSGVYRADKGEILLQGTPVGFHSQREANQSGISIVYQERSLVPGLTVGENIFAGRQPVFWCGPVNWKRLYSIAKELLFTLGFDIDPRQLVGDLSPALQQIVEIAKALSIKPRVLILDEPTATVTERETAAIFQLLRELSAGGMAIVYISHRLPEIFQIADRVSVLKDGSLTGTASVGSIDEDWIIKRMVGRELYTGRAPMLLHSPKILEVSRLSDGRKFSGVSFFLRQGEIVSFSGLVGAGRTEVFRTVFGLEKKSAGDVQVFEKRAEIRNPRDAIRLGLGYMPEDRKEQGLFLEMNVSENIVVAALKKCQRFVEIDNRKVAHYSETYRTQLKISTPSIRQKARILSGGNQQKVMLARWLLVNPRILIVDEPTRGIDVGTKLEIYEILRQLRREGSSIIVISSDLPEVLSISDRIYVMWNGMITGEVMGGEATEEILMKYASGMRRGEGTRDDTSTS